VSRFRSSWPIAVVGIALAVLVTWFVSGPAGRSAPSGSRGSSEIHVARGPAAASHDTAFPSPAPPAASDLAGGDIPPAVGSDDMSTPWAVVDMEEIRRALPNNIYWRLSFPTKDPQVLEERDAERARWNVEYGKMLSGTASEDEIRAYYDLRARLSGDYIEFTSYLLDHYKDDLSERDVGLLDLARRLHLARLEEIPRKVQEAFDRKRRQDEARAAWLADEAEFGHADSDSHQ
jgi:hypothetical protein